MKKKNDDFYVKLNTLLFSIIVSVFIIIPFIVKFEVSKGVYYDNPNKLYQAIVNVYNSFEEFDIKWSLLFLFVFSFVYRVFKEHLSKKQIIIGIGTSLLLTCITMIGKALSINDNLVPLFQPSYQIVKSIVIGLGYFFIYYILYCKIIKLNIKIDFSKKKGKLSKFFDKNQTIISIILFIIAWTPILALYYPGVASGDTLDQLAQFFNLRAHCWSAKAIILKNNNVIINKHHSVLFTIILGSIVKIGHNMISYNFGMFLFVIIQTIILITCFVFILYYMKRLSIPTGIRFLVLLYFCFCPLISGYTIAAIKDTLGSILIVVYNLFLLQIIRNYNSIIKNKFFVCFFMFIIMLIFMIKSNAMFIILFSYMSMIIYYVSKNEYNKTKKLVIVLIIPLVLFLSYDKILLTSFEVTGTNKKEAYSIPFMQIARLAHRNDAAISDEDKAIINKVLNYKSIKSDYLTRLADPVKNTYRKDVTEKELEDFWGVYFKYFRKYPKLYVAAFVNSTYGYFFPEVGEVFGIERVDGRLNNEDFVIKNLDSHLDYMKIYQKICLLFVKIPFFSFFNHVAYYNWFLIFSVFYILRKKMNKYIVPITSLIAVLLSSVISPINGSFRYILPIVFCLPIIFLIDYLVANESNIRE
ncbi:MAG: DUF6020 family protein [Bacilli bacterium]|nr:DUF6020 family protein [Bacilli bacterium]